MHVAAYVCPRTGGLHFGRVELPQGTPVEESDFISAEDLSVLLRNANTRLVVIASGDSLELATMLLPVTNVIAPRDIVAMRAMATWVKTFYEALPVKSLADACQLAAAASGAPMRLLSQQVPSDIEFQLGQLGAVRGQAGCVESRSCARVLDLPAGRSPQYSEQTRSPRAPAGHVVCRACELAGPLEPLIVAARGRR